MTADFLHHARVLQPAQCPVCGMSLPLGAVPRTCEYRGCPLPSDTLQCATCWRDHERDAHHIGRG